MSISRFEPYFRLVSGTHLNRIVDALNMLVTNNGNVAAGGTATGNATVLGTGVSFVTGADNTKSVKLPVGLAGTGNTSILVVFNTVNNKLLSVFPPTGGTINGASADGNLSMGNGSAAIFFSNTPLVWRTVPLAP